MTTVAVLGTGALGAAMVRRLRERDHDVRVWNRTRAKAEPLAAVGAVVCDSPADAATGAGVLLTVLSNGPVVRAQAEEALPALADGAVWVQAATVGLSALDDLVKVADEHDVPLVDAPVSGGPEDAGNGRLAVLASGTEEAIALAAPVLDDLGRFVLRVGPVGAGSALKLVVNSWLMAMLEGTAEAVALAEGLGIDGSLLADAVADGPLTSPWLQSVSRAMAASDFGGGGSLELSLKDARLARDAIESKGLDLPLTALVAGRLARAAAAGATVQQQLVEVSRGR